MLFEVETGRSCVVELIPGQPQIVAGGCQAPAVAVAAIVSAATG